MRPPFSLMSLSALLVGCNRGKVSLGEIETVEDVEDACQEHEPEEITLDVIFPAQAEQCPWGEADNLPEPANGYMTARVEQNQELDLPDEVVICDMTFQFGGLVPEDVQIMVYDDHFFFTFNDIVLASSYGAGVQRMELQDEMPVYDWAGLVGDDYHVDEGEGAFCLGEEAGQGECDIPSTEVEGEMSLHYDKDLINHLSLLAIESERYEFAFVTTGDDDAASDCMHEEFGFSVKIPYLEAGR